MAISVDANSGNVLNIGAGYQNWVSPVDSPAGTPRGALFVVHVVWQNGYGPIDTPSYGGVASVLVDNQGAFGGGLGESMVYLYYIADITGRSDDIWRHESTGLSREGVPIYLDANLPLILVDDGKASGGSGDVGPTLTGTGFAFAVGSSVSAGGEGVGNIAPMVGYTAVYETVHDNAAHGGYYDAAQSGTDQVGVNFNNSNRHAVVGAIFNEGDAVIAPDAFGSEMGFGGAGPTIVPSADSVLLPVRFGTEMGFTTGLALPVEAARDVALVGGGIDATDKTVEITVAGEHLLVGQQGQKPLFKLSADITGGALVYSDGITDPPEPVWNEDGDDYVYTDL